jgi:hypothetical protein
MLATEVECKNMFEYSGNQSKEKNIFWTIHFTHSCDIEPFYYLIIFISVFTFIFKVTLLACTNCTK